MTKFTKGQSGNPAGRPKGVGDKRTQMRSLFEPHAEALIEKAVQLALEGDTVALRMCLERIVAPIKNSSDIQGQPASKSVEITEAEAERILRQIEKRI